MRKAGLRTLAVETGSGNVFADLGLPNPEEHQVKPPARLEAAGSSIHRRAVIGPPAGTLDADGPKLAAGPFDAQKGDIAPSFLGQRDLNARTFAYLAELL